MTFSSPPAVPRILFVCLGNICRSPTAEAVMRAMAPDWMIDSAGTGDWHVGEPPYGPMQAAAKARGYDLSRLRARQIVRADFERFDRIVVMDGQNAAHVERLRPPGNRTPVCRLMEYAPETGHADVPDPYYSRDFDQTLDLVEAAIEGMLRMAAGEPRR